ncbi:MAG: hypothetical protein KKB31_07560 [Nanoarchaeota archaeon]|nr:hypothetical protein [Nanoarchaeota archaeon]
MVDGYTPNNPENYAIANRATVWIARKLATTPATYTVAKPVGNVNSGSFAPEFTELEHSSNFAGINKQDKKIITEVKGKVTIEIDEVVKENLRYALLSGDPVSTTIDVPLQETKTFVGTPGTITVNSGATIQEVLGIYSQLGTEGADGFEEGATADYTVNLTTGVITRVDGGLITAGETVVVNYTVRKTNLTKHIIMENTNIEARLWVISAGAAAGPKEYIYFPSAKIKPSGDINLLSKDAWRVVTLEMDILEDPEVGFGEWTNYI